MGVRTRIVGTVVRSTIRQGTYARLLERIRGVLFLALPAGDLVQPLCRSGTHAGGVHDPGAFLSVLLCGVSHQRLVPSSVVAMAGNPWAVCCGGQCASIRIGGSD